MFLLNFGSNTHFSCYSHTATQHIFAVFEVYLEVHEKSYLLNIVRVNRIARNNAGEDVVG